MNSRDWLDPIIVVFIVSLEITPGSSVSTLFFVETVMRSSKTYAFFEFT